MDLVREAGPSDIDALIRLNVELHEFSAAGVPSRLRIASAYDTQRMRARWASLLRDRAATTFVAIDGDEIVGYAEIHMVEPENDPGLVPTRRSHLQSLLVTREHRGDGVGSSLLAAAEAWARDRGAQEIELDHWVFDGGPEGFYERAGYQVLSRMLVKRV
jgi:GNAT superfamily N-acetyltransferase